jgi:putative tricarboxylic transport membrane protein
VFDVNVFLQGAGLILDWWMIPLVVFGVFWGIIFSGIPGLSGSTGMAVLLPVCFSLGPLYALVLLLGVYTGAMWGGAIPAILINTPGSAPAIFTGLDGYPLAQQGKASEALGISLMASVAGGVVGSLALMIVIFPLSSITLMFGPPEMFMVAIFGLTIVSSLGAETFTKGLLAGIFGMVVGLVGLSHTGTARATFGFVNLLDGVPLLPVLIGLVALPELFNLLAKGDGNIRLIEQTPSMKRVWAGCIETLKRPKILLQSSFVGLFVGAMPGTGGDIASIVAYNESRRLSSEPELYGKGSRDGLIAAEAANNSQEGGAIATMLALGFPGSSGTAVLLGALLMQGWVPGPRMFTENAPVVYGAILSTFVSLFALLALGIPLCNLGAKIAKSSTRIIVPCIVVLTFVGAYVIRSSLFDVCLLLAFGLLGWGMRRHGYPPTAVILGLVLGPMADAELVRIYQSFDEGFWIILMRPISGIMAMLVVFFALRPFVKRMMEKRRAAGLTTVGAKDS